MPNAIDNKIVNGSEMEAREFSDGCPSIFPYIFIFSVKQAAEFDWPAWWQWSGQAENNDITTTMLLSTCPLSTPRCVQIADCCPRTGRSSMLCTQAYSIIF